MNPFYYNVGWTLWVVIAVSFSLMFMAVVAGYLALKKRYILAGFFATIINAFRYPLSRVMSSAKLDMMCVALLNQANLEKFKRAKRRALFAPHCLRHLECPAPTTKFGIDCKLCGKCVFTDIKKRAEELGYDLYILSGSSFIKHILKEKRYDSALGIGCYYELNKVMSALRNTPVITYGVPLTISGCINTKTDMSEVMDAMELGL